MKVHARRVCFPDGYMRSGAKWRAACHCGYATTPRTTRERAREALEVEHGWTSTSCGICEQEPGPRPWEALRPLLDESRNEEMYVCRDDKACHVRYETNRQADLLKCGCYQSSVRAIGHYHEGVKPRAVAS